MKKKMKFSDDFITKTAQYHGSSYLVAVKARPGGAAATSLHTGLAAAAAHGRVAAPRTPREGSQVEIPIAPVLVRHFRLLN